MHNNNRRGTKHAGAAETVFDGVARDFHSESSDDRRLMAFQVVAGILGHIDHSRACLGELASWDLAGDSVAEIRVRNGNRRQRSSNQRKRISSGYSFDRIDGIG
jgi:hypothetical protein